MANEDTYVASFTKTTDNVNHPAHYQIYPNLEAIDVIGMVLTDAEFKGYLKGNSLKYRLRAGKKNSLEEDIKKAMWYEKRLREWK